MKYYMVVVKKGDEKITHCFEAVSEALDWLQTGFVASLDDSENEGTVYSIEEKP